MAADLRAEQPERERLEEAAVAVEGAYKHLIQTRFKRAGVRWKGKGFDEVLELRIARVNGTLDGFWQRARARGRAA